MNRSRFHNQTKEGGIVERGKCITAITVILSFALLMVGVKEVRALGTKAGTPIGNAATATYRDAENNEFTSESELIQTTVAEVCGVNISDGPLEVDAIDGQTIDIPIEITNTGNGENTFDLVEDSSAFETKIYLESSPADGIADAAEVAAGEINSVTLDFNGTAHIVIQVTASSAPASEAFTLTVTGTLPEGCDDTLGITTTVINDALINASKNVDKDTATSGDTLSFEILFENNGTLAAKGVPGINVDGASDGILLSDAIPEGTQFVAASADGEPKGGPNGFVVFSTDPVPDAPDTALSLSWTATEPGDVSDVTHVGFFMPDTTPGDGTSEAVLPTGQQGIMNFQVTVNDPFDGPSLRVENFAQFFYRLDDGTTDKATTTGTTDTTIPASEIGNIAAGGLDETTANNIGTWTNAGGGAPWVNGGNNIPNGEEDMEVDGTDADDPDSFKDDNYASNVSAGEFVEFFHRVRNDSVVDDVVNLEAVDLSNLPAGTFVEFFDFTGATKLINTNPSDDGLLDVGTVTGSGGTKDLLVKVFIPANTAAVVLDGTVDFFVDIRFSSSVDPSESDLSRNNIDGVIGAGADIGAPNTVAGVDGAANDQPDGNTDGADDSDDITPATQTTTVAPGDSISYPIHFANTGGSSDSYGLNASLPPGTSATFTTDPNCDGDPSDGTATTDTGLVGGTITASGSTDTVLNVQSVANFTAGDRIIVGEEQRVIASVDSGANQITIDTDADGNNDTNPDGALPAAPAAGLQISEFLCLVLTVQVNSDADPVAGVIVITATSGNSGQQDSMEANIVIQSTCDITLNPPLSGQLPPGGSTTYTHSVFNGSNFTGFVRIDLVTADPVLSYLFVASGADTWFIDGVDGTIQGGGVGDDTFLADGATGILGSVFVQLGPEESASFRIQVQAGEAVAENTTENVSFRAVLDGDGDFSTTDDQCEGTINDTTKVIEGFLVLTKDANVVDSGTFSSTDGTCSGTTAAPEPDTVAGGPCDTITYTITYKNDGIQNAIDVIVTDMIPNNTTYVTDSAVFDGDCNGTGGDPINGSDTVAFSDSSNIITWTVTDPIPPGQESCLIFDVTIDGE